MANRHWRQILLATSLAVTVACGQPSPEELLSDARDALAAGEIRTAEIHLKNLLQREPTHATARLLLGQVSLAAGDLPAAEDGLRRALDLGADPAAVQLPLLRALIEQGKFRDALAQSAVGPVLTGEDRVLALVFEGTAHRGLNSVERAEAAYRAALAIDPESAVARTELATLFLAARRIDEANALLADVLADQPDFAPALLARGNLERAQSRNEAARESFERAIEIMDGLGQRRSQQYSLALAQLTEMQLGQGQLDMANANADALLSLNEQHPVARYLKASVEVEQGNLDGAEARLAAVIADFPQYWPAHRLLGAINVRQNQDGQARMYLRSAVTNNPSDDAARLMLAELYIREGDLSAARDLFKASPSIDATEGLFLAMAGRASLNAGRPDAAAEFFEQSEAQLAQDARDLVNVSSIYVAAGEFERAVRVLESSAFDDAESQQLTDYLLALVHLRQGNLESADASALRLVESQPQAAWPLNLRGTVALLSRDLPGAQRLFSRALELEPRNTASLINLARVAFAQNEQSQAAEYLRRVVEIDSHEPTATLGLAQLAVARGDYDDAMQWVERAPQTPLRFQLEGDIQSAQRRFEAAAASYSRAYDAQPSAELAVRAFGAARQAGQQRPEAKLEDWIADHPNDPEVHFALGTIELGRNNHDSAISHYESTIASNPRHAAALNNLAYLHGERGDRRAVEYGARALEAQPDNPAIADTLGWLHVRGGSAAQGLPLLERAAAALPDNREVRYHWAVALAETGATDRARSMLEELVAGDDFEGRQDAERRLAALRNGGR